MSNRSREGPNTAATGPVRVRFGAFELDEANARLTRDGRAVALAPKPLALLCALVRRPGGLLTKHQLLDEVWGHQFVSDSVLKTAISDIRTALADDPRVPRFIETVSRRGYRFIAPTTVMATAAPPVLRPAAGGSGTAQFVGREAELSRLHGAWDRACAGQRTVVFVAGEPGIGKTALVEHFIASLGDALCARGQCVDQYGAGEPYLPVLEALSELCRVDDTLPDILRTAAPAWLLQLPWLCSPEERDRLRTELAGVGPERMLREMGELLARRADRRPLLIVTEDLHWGDGPTIQLIDYLARRHSSASLMWLVTFRLAEVVATDHPLGSLRHELRLHGLCEEIVLDPFSETDVAACVASRSGALASNEAFVRALYERSDGVPLFVMSVLREVLGPGADDTSGVDWVARLAEAGVPDNLAGIVSRYMARLDPAQRELLSAASVLGAEFHPATLARVLDRDAASVERLCESLAHEKTWLVSPPRRPGGMVGDARYVFSHALFRQVLYEGIAPLALAQLHRRVGAALAEARDAGMAVAPTELAMHFERGGEPMTALRHFVDAADAALQHLAPAECLELTEHALNLVASVPAGTERDALEISLATLRGVSAFQVLGVGDPTRSALGHAYSLLEVAPQHPLRGLVVHGFGWILSLRAEYADALAVAGRAEALALTSSDPAMMLAAATVQASVHMLQGRPREACRWVERALPSTDAFETEPGRSFAADPGVLLLAIHALMLLHLGSVVTGRERLEQACDRARKVGQPMARLVVTWYAALFELRLGHAERVKALAQEMDSLVDEFSLGQGRAASRWFHGWADARLGMPRDGYSRIMAAREEDLRFGMVSADSETLGYAAEALLLAGDVPAARELLDEALAAAERHTERIYLVQLLLLQGAIDRAEGDHPGADRSIRRALAEARSQEASWFELLSLLALCESGGATREDMDALDALLERIPEATATDAAMRARALIDA